jgi:hypothetical protein
MALSAKTATKTATKPAPKTPAKTAAKTAAKAKVKPVAAEPFMRFYHSEALRAKTDATLGALEVASNPEAHRDRLADLVEELIESGMDYYFLRALKLAKMGFVAEQSARLGMSGSVKLIASVSRKFIVRMDGAQLVVVSAHIRALTS